MVAKTFFIEIVKIAIREMPGGTKIKLHEIYKSYKDILSSDGHQGDTKLVVDIRHGLRECAERGDLPDEPRFKNDIRWAIRHLKDEGVLRHVGTPHSGEWLRI